MKISSLYKGIGMMVVFIFILSCAVEPSPLDKMTPPIRVVRNDTITEVEDNNGRMYILNSSERTNYGAAFLQLGDTLDLGN